MEAVGIFAPSSIPDRKDRAKPALAYFTQKLCDYQLVGLGAPMKAQNQRRQVIAASVKIRSGCIQHLPQLFNIMASGARLPSS